MAYGGKINENLNLTGEKAKKLEPNIYIGNIIKVEVSTKTVNKVEVSSLNIIFKDDLSKIEHLEQFTEPKGTDKTSIDKAEQYFHENLMHIANSILTPEQLEVLVKTNFTTFESLISGYTSTLTPNLGKCKQQIKIIGATFKSDGKDIAFTKFPNFNSRTLDPNIMGSEDKTFNPVPYITKIDSGVKLAFGKNEKKDNQSYFEAKNSVSSEESSKKATNDDELFND